MNKKSLSLKIKLLIIFILSVLLVVTGLCFGLFIRDLYIMIAKSNNLYQFLISLVSTLIVGTISIKLLMILLRDYKDNKKEKTTKWYFDKILIAGIPIWIIAIVSLMAFCSVDDIVPFFLISLIMFVLIGIVIAPNAVSYAVKDMSNWKSIFNSKGNLGKQDRKNGFYKMDTPVPFEKKVYSVVLKKQILGFNLFFICAIIFIIITTFVITKLSSEYSGGIFEAAMHVRIRRAKGVSFFILIFLLTFSIPLLAYYITNTKYKLKIIKHHEYIAYHAIVNSVDGYTIKIHSDKLHYRYNYCTCVGIRPKKVNNTEAILIFLPDDVLLFPVKKEVIK